MKKETILSVLKEIRDELRQAKQIIPLTPPAVELEAFAKWEKFYKEEFGIDSLGNVTIPPKQEGFDRLVVVAKGLTPNRVFDACRKHFKCWRYIDYLDAITSDPAPSVTYAVWFRDRIEADEEMKDKSANDLADEKIPGITLIERMLLELVYFKETGKHLDVENVTLCVGSRTPDGGVPSVDWFGVTGGMGVYWYRPGRRGDGLRVRVAVR